MGWNLRRAMSIIAEIAGDRFVTYYSTPDSHSAIGILLKAELTVEEENAIVGLFPDYIRVEFMFDPGGNYNKTVLEIDKEEITHKIPTKRNTLGIKP